MIRAFWRNFKWPKKFKNSITLEWNALSTCQSVIQFLARKTHRKQLISKFYEFLYLYFCITTFLITEYDIFQFNLLKNHFYLGQNFQRKCVFISLSLDFRPVALLFLSSIDQDGWFVLKWQSILLLDSKLNLKAKNEIFLTKKKTFLWFWYFWKRS